MPVSQGRTWSTNQLSSADIIGRKFAFNISLFICSIACLLAGAMPNWASLGFFVALLGFGGGGNLILDTTVFLEFLPGNKQCEWALINIARADTGC